jgi:hypothetical protein
VPSKTSPRDPCGGVFVVEAALKAKMVRVVGELLHPADISMTFLLTGAVSRQ